MKPVIHCESCGYNNLEGNTSLQIPANFRNKIKYRKRFQEYQCDDCYRIITSSLKELHEIDQWNGGEQSSPTDE